MKNVYKIIPLGGLALFLTPERLEAQESLPNVIFIMADDLGIGDLGCYGQQKIKTPAIDKLAANGMRFTQHYTGSTVSAPSRCSLLTGKHTGNSYIRGNKDQKSANGETYDLSLPKEEVTVADIFKKKNYVTACIGKWGLGGPDTEGHPNRHGFDYFFGYLGQLNAHSYYPSFLWENDNRIMLNKEVYSHDLVMQKALDFVEKNSGSPFFIYLTPTIPHAELIVPEGELGNYEDQFCETPYIGNHYCSQPKPRATYAAMVSRLDKDIQRIMDLLEEKGIADNTIVIFTSDNGAHKEGGHDPAFFNSNGPFRGIKRDLYDGGIRTPFVVHWPAKIGKEKVSYHVSAFWDFMPTVCEIVGERKPSGSDGISYLPALTGEGQQANHDYLYWEFHEEGGKRAILKDQWKLIELFVNNPEKRRYELYNLNSDPGEIADVTGQYPDKLEELKPILGNARSKNPNWNFKEN
ncbi:MAG: arylsulfatase [Prevotella sp.]|jgi:arylsulfatase A-like enzyme|nr:arylsulfatase [Prevotella sp.]